ncbi:MAG: pitrilysin family protein [Chloroflexi bacterium]|nr:pitrilysin family protein [Chloroflexota bacterium]MDA1228675.1 pitrilysin family protein [Chloroflexota bacterium]
MTIEITDKQSAFNKTTLPNGLRIITSEMPHTRSVSICIYIGVGSRYETPEQAGVSHYLEHMVFKGTKTHPEPQEISAIIESTGGILNAGTEHESTVYWCKVAQPHFQPSLELLLDILRNSVFEQDAIEKERMVVIEELNMVNDYPNYLVEALIDEMLWPDHPLGRDIGGSKESVNGITRQMLLDFVDEHYSPSNVVISVAGNVPHDAVVDCVEANSKGWKSKAKASWAPFEGVQSESQSRLEYRRTEQVHMSVALPCISLTHPDRHAIDLLSVILGEGMSSRLFVEVREKRALAYDVHSSVAHFLDTGAFVVDAGVDPKRIYDAVQTILEQIGSLRDTIPEEELLKAQSLSAGRLQLRMEDTRAVASWGGTQELLLGEIQDLDEVISHLNAVTTDDLQRVANEYLVTDKLNMAVVGPCRGYRRLEKMLKL